MRKNIYTANKSYTPTFQAIQATSNKETLRHILNESFELYCKMKLKHQYNNKIKNMHWNMSCEKAALYLTIRKYYPLNAYDWIDLSTKSQGAKTSKSINHSLKNPLMKRIFLRVMKKMAAFVFGEKAGFKFKWVSFSNNEAKFDILDCPYCLYMSELGCPELTKIFCDSDVYAYGNLKDFVFERTQTLGTGGNKCDFCIRRR